MKFYIIFVNFVSGIIVMEPFFLPSIVVVKHVPSVGYMPFERSCFYIRMSSLSPSPSHYALDIQENI